MSDAGAGWAGVMQGLTGEVLERAKLEKEQKRKDEDTSLQTNLSLFSHMMENPDKYDDDQIRGFADTMAKNNRLKSIVGDHKPIVESLLGKRQQQYQQAKLTADTSEERLRPLYQRMVEQARGGPMTGVLDMLNKTSFASAEEAEQAASKRAMMEKEYALRTQMEQDMKRADRADEMATRARIAKENAAVWSQDQIAHYMAYGTPERQYMPYSMGSMPSIGPDGKPYLNVFNKATGQVDQTGLQAGARPRDPRSGWGSGRDPSLQPVIGQELGRAQQALRDWDSNEYSGKILQQLRLARMANQIDSEGLALLRRLEESRAILEREASLEAAKSNTAGRMRAEREVKAGVGSPSPGGASPPSGGRGPVYEGNQWRPR